jgi:hypothetical protein
METIPQNSEQFSHNGVDCAVVFQEFSTNLKFGCTKYDKELDRTNKVLQKNTKKSEHKLEQKKSKSKPFCPIIVCINKKSQSISIVSTVDLKNNEIKRILNLPFITGRIVG